jgi:4-hydroxy-tetrahydrodipicolinate synthase
MTQTTEHIRARLDGGIIPAVPVTFDEHSRIHTRAHEAYLGHMADQPIAGVTVWAHTGRGLMLDRQTADSVLKDWRAALPDKVIIAGAGAPPNSDPSVATDCSVEMAERAAQLGADALLCYAPSWLRGSEESDRLIIEHHRRLASVGLPIVLFYLYEDAGGISYSPSVLDELLSMPESVGIKMATLDSVMTYQDVSRRLFDKHEQQLLITGEDRFLGYSLMRGARSALIGMGAACTQLQADLIRAYLDADAALFLKLSRLVDMLAEATFIKPMEGYIRRLLWVLVHQGLIPIEAANDPWGPELPQSEYEEVGRLLTALQGVGY